MAIDSGYWGNGTALDSGYWESGEDTKVLTNADHIRSMTDEDLADFLVDLADDGNLLIREWLKQPYKEES